MRIHRLHLIAGLLLPALFPTSLWGKPLVVVSIPPQKAFVEAIAGEAVDILVLVQPGQNPESFSITPRRLAELSKATVYFTIGVPLETALLPRLQANYPGIQIVDTSAGIRKRSLEDHFHSHSDADQGHAHSEDPHIWLSPGLVKIQLRHYVRTLSDLLPEQSQTISQNQSLFLQELDRVDSHLQQTLKNLKGAAVFVYHPAFGYFLDRYGLKQETVELQGKQPSPKQLRFLIKLAREYEARVIFVQPQFERHSAQALAKAINGRVESMDPLAENYLDNLLRMGEIIASSYQ